MIVASVTAITPGIQHSTIFTAVKMTIIFRLKIVICFVNRLRELVRTSSCGGSYEHQVKNKKNNSVYPCKPQFYYTKVGF